MFIFSSDLTLDVNIVSLNTTNFTYQPNKPTEQVGLYNMYTLSNLSNLKTIIKLLNFFLCNSFKYYRYINIKNFEYKIIKLQQLDEVLMKAEVFVYIQSGANGLGSFKISVVNVEDIGFKLIVKC